MSAGWLGGGDNSNQDSVGDVSWGIGRWVDGENTNPDPVSDIQIIGEGGEVVLTN